MSDLFLDPRARSMANNGGCLMGNTVHISRFIFTRLKAQYPFNPNVKEDGSMYIKHVLLQMSIHCEHVQYRTYPSRNLYQNDTGKRNVHWVWTQEFFSSSLRSSRFLSPWHLWQRWSRKQFNGDFGFFYLKLTEKLWKDRVAKCHRKRQVQDWLPKDNFFFFSRSLQVLWLFLGIDVHIFTWDGVAFTRQYLLHLFQIVTESLWKIVMDRKGP